MIGSMTEQDLVLNLKAAGCDGILIREFLNCWRAGKTTEQMRLLAQKRGDLLEQVHREEKQIYCLDYLVNQIEKMKPIDPAEDRATEKSAQASVPDT